MLCVCVCEAHHTDVEGVEQVERQGSDQVHKQPGGDVVNADGAGIVHDLAGTCSRRWFGNSARCLTHGKQKFVLNEVL